VTDDYAAARVRRLDHDAVDEETVVPWVEGASGVAIVCRPEGREILLSSRQGKTLPDPLAQSGPALGSGHSFGGHCCEQGYARDYLFV
jgi:hypothetical protein